GRVAVGAIGILDVHALALLLAERRGRGEQAAPRRESGLRRTRLAIGLVDFHRGASRRQLRRSAADRKREQRQKRDSLHRGSPPIEKRSDFTVKKSAPISRGW